MLSVKDLKFSIGETSILNGVNFEVAAGERLGIIGPNGSGKTTLFNCLSGFNIPDSGQILLAEKDITFLAPHRRANRGLGRVFQNFGVFKEMTLEENIITALETKNSPGLIPWSNAHSENIQRAEESLKLVGLKHKAKQKAGSLSGGQMRLLEISRTLAFGAEVFLLDEPTAGVSPKMKQEVEKVLERLQELKKTLLIIEHDMNFIQKLCDRIIVLDVGQVILSDTPERVRENPLLQEIYFGSNNQQSHKQ